MAKTTPFTIGTRARCSDGVCGEVSRVVVDPVARAVTHLVVEPRHHGGLGRLVPLDLVDAGPDEVTLRCTLAEFGRLAHAEETQFVPGGAGLPYDPGQVLAWPYYGLGPGTDLEFVAPITYDTVPLGEVAVHRGDPVHAADGSIGRVQGLVIDPRSRHVTHVLLQEGHLWGRKEVAIPISAVTRVSEAGIELGISKHEVQELPPVDVDHPDRPG